MSGYRITRPPRRLRKARLDNLVLVPASLLPFKEQWMVSCSIPLSSASACLDNPLRFLARWAGSWPPNQPGKETASL